MDFEIGEGRLRHCLAILLLLRLSQFASEVPQDSTLLLEGGNPGVQEVHEWTFLMGVLGSRAEALICGRTYCSGVN